MKRDKNGKVIEGFFSRWRNRRMAKKMAKGAIPHGRTRPGEIPSRDEQEMKRLWDNQTLVVKWWNEGEREPDIASKLGVRLGNCQALVRGLRNQGRIAS